MGYIRHPNFACQVCDKPIYIRKSQLEKNKGHAFCSLACYGKSLIKEKYCLICGIQIRTKDNKKTCSKPCANKYLAQIKPFLNKPKVKVFDLRRVKIRLLDERGEKCERCDYNKVEILQVHHKDRNRENGDFANLELICPNCHSEEHLLKKEGLKRYNYRERSDSGLFQRS